MCLAITGSIIGQKKGMKKNVAVVSSNNWGLSFQEDGKAPVIDIDREKLEELDGYYLGDEKNKKSGYSCGRSWNSNFACFKSNSKRDVAYR